MLYNWVSISSDSLQLDLSMLTLKLVVKTMKNDQYKTAGACLKGIQLLECMKAEASFQVVLRTLARF